MEENKNEITRKEYKEFAETIDAIKEYLSNSYSSLNTIILRRLEETSTPILKKIRQNLPSRRIRGNQSDKEFYGN